MSVPTMEELAETFAAAYFGDDGWTVDDETRRGLRAVLDRLKPVVAEAHQDGVRAGRSEIMMSNHNDYATRIIDQIKGA